MRELRYAECSCLDRGLFIRDTVYSEDKHAYSNSSSPQKTRYKYRLGKLHILALAWIQSEKSYFAHFVITHESDHDPIFAF